MGTHVLHIEKILGMRRIVGAARKMRRQHHIVEFLERIGNVGFVVIDIDCGAGDDVLLLRGNQSLGIDD